LVDSQISTISHLPKRLFLVKISFKNGIPSKSPGKTLIKIQPEKFNFVRSEFLEFFLLNVSKLIDIPKNIFQNILNGNYPAALLHRSNIFVALEEWAVLRAVGTLFRTVDSVPTARRTPILALLQR